MIRKPEFTQWWFHQLSEGIRSRHRALALAENRTPHHELVYITWTNCIGRNKCKAEKLYHHDRMKDLKINDAWDHCISWQKKKLTRLYDTLEAWRKREHLILKRMNTHNFSSNLAPHSIWNFKVYKQVAKAKKLVRKQFSRPAAPSSFNMSYVRHENDWRHTIIGTYPIPTVSGNSASRPTS